MAKYSFYWFHRPATYDVFTLQSKKITVVIYGIVVDYKQEKKKRKKSLVYKDENSVSFF